MATVLLDVGGHLGETLDVALDPRFRFDSIHTFEPATACVNVLMRYRDRRLRVHPFGLAASDAVVPLFAAGSAGASVFQDKVAARDSVIEAVELRDVSAWLSANLSESDTIYLKLNCEGGEADIVDRLWASGQLAWIDSVLLSLDVLKVPSMAHRADDVLAKLSASVRLVLRDPSNQKAVEEWLRDMRIANPSIRARIGWAVGAPLPPVRRVRKLAARILPRGAYLWAARRVGPSRRHHSR